MFPIAAYQREYDDGEPVRWKVVVTTGSALNDEHTETIYVEELEELQDLIERGPD
jgi:hypothetical protein